MMVSMHLRQLVMTSVLGAYGARHIVTNTDLSASSDDNDDASSGAASLWRLYR